MLEKKKTWRGGTASQDPYLLLIELFSFSKQFCLSGGGGGGQPLWSPVSME